jgi:HSP20 family protein
MFGVIRLATRGAGDVSVLERRISRLLNDAFGGSDWQDRESAASSWMPPVDIFEGTDEIRIQAEVPGVRPEDVKISVEDNVLTVQGTKQQAAERDTGPVHRYERTYGSFERSFTLPTTVDATKVTAGYENGVLTVTLPKAERAKPRQIQVEVMRS